MIDSVKSPSKLKFSVFCLAIAIAAMGTGCSDSGSTETHDSSANAANADSMKAVAEAEAAEEEFAKNKSAKRSIASTKGSRKKPSGESIYIVQVGTFKLEENAKRIEAKLKSAGLPVFQKKIEREGATFYAVRIEPTPNRTEAEKFVSSIKAATGESSLILSVGR